MYVSYCPIDGDMTVWYTRRPRLDGHGYTPKTYSILMIPGTGAAS